MRFGIIGAMESEVEILKKSFSCEEIPLRGLNFYKGKAGENEVFIVKSGIGKVCAAISAVLLIEHFNCGCVINTGVAGGLYDECKVGDVVVGTAVAHHDVDITPFGYERGQVPAHPLYYPCDEKLSAKALELLGDRAVSGLIISGEQFICADSKVQELKSLFKDVKAVEMEGSAVGQACYDLGVPFLVLRAISDGANDGAAMSFEEFELLAAKRSSELLIKLVQSF